MSALTLNGPTHEAREAGSPTREFKRPGDFQDA